MKIQAYKTNVGTFFKVVDAYYGNKSLTDMGFVSIDGKPVEEILKEPSGWYLTSVELTNFVKKVSGKSMLVGYKIIDERLVNDNFPKTIPKEDVEAIWDDDSETHVWVGKYPHMQSYYTTEYSLQPETVEIVNVEVEYLRELFIDNYNSPVQMQVSMINNNDSYGSKPHVSYDLSSVCNYSDIEKMLTPEFLLHERPCSLTSQQVYKIIRSHVLNNINGAVARVSSNYDFCFEVKKVVKTTPFEVKSEQLTQRGNSYKPPRFSKKTQDSKLDTIFEMTWWGADKGRGYGSYTVIQGWEAPNLQALADQVKFYLEDLMKIINAPAHECKECKGCGMIFERIETNERENFDN